MWGDRQSVKRLDTFNAEFVNATRTFNDAFKEEAGTFNGTFKLIALVYAISMIIQNLDLIRERMGSSVKFVCDELRWVWTLRVGRWAMRP